MSSKEKSGGEPQKTGEYRDEIDFEALARANGAQTMYSLVEEIGKCWWEIIHALEAGEQIDYQELERARTRMAELDKMMSEFLYRVGDISDVQARNRGLYLEPGK